MESKRVSETTTRMAQMMTPNDANFLGKVFGGSILALIDLTASATASKYAGNICVTASFDRVDFHEPIEIGELVELEGFISFVGRTSVEVTIDVYATNLLKNIRRHSNTARVTMVALKDGKPTEVPRLICETDSEKRLFLLGKIRRETRQYHLNEIKRVQVELDTMHTDLLDDLISEKTNINQIAKSNIK